MKTMEGVTKEYSIFSGFREAFLLSRKFDMPAHYWAKKFCNIYAPSAVERLDPDFTTITGSVLDQTVSAAFLSQMILRYYRINESVMNDLEDLDRLDVSSDVLLTPAQQISLANTYVSIGDYCSMHDMGGETYYTSARQVFDQSTSPDLLSTDLRKLTNIELCTRLEIAPCDEPGPLTLARSIRSEQLRRSLRYREDFCKLLVDGFERAFDVPTMYDVARNYVLAEAQLRQSCLSNVVATSLGANYPVSLRLLVESQHGETSSYVLTHDRYTKKGSAISSIVRQDSHRYVLGTLRGSSVEEFSLQAGTIGAYDVSIDPCLEVGLDIAIYDHELLSGAVAGTLVDLSIMQS
jgi:hypothetical protein